MTHSSKTESINLNRREVLKRSGLALGGLALGGALIGPGQRSAQAVATCPDGPACRWDNPVKAQNYSYFNSLEPFYPFSDTDPFSNTTATTIQRLGDNEMRITFMGSAIPLRARGQAKLPSPPGGGKPGSGDAAFMTSLLYYFHESLDAIRDAPGYRCADRRDYRHVQRGHA